MLLSFNKHKFRNLWSVFSILGKTLSLPSIVTCQYICFLYQVANVFVSFYYLEGYNYKYNLDFLCGQKFRAKYQSSYLFTHQEYIFLLGTMDTLLFIGVKYFKSLTKLWSCTTWLLVCIVMLSEISIISNLLNYFQPRAIRHPASGYVQGINDLATPFLVVFLSEYLEGGVEKWSISDLSPDNITNIEADCYWCLSKLLDGMQDHYTFAQPGIQRLVFKLKELVRRIDGNLSFWPWVLCRSHLFEFLQLVYVSKKKNLPWFTNFLSSCP